MPEVSPPAKPKPTYRLKITLEAVDPPVWRRVLVPSSITLARLHAVIQGAMGWTDSHLHQFDIDGVRYGPGDDDDHDFDDDEPAVDERRVALHSVASAKAVFTYTYDLGDDWRHRIEVEEVTPPDRSVAYPRAVDGARACPPEDVGGPYGYGGFLEAIADPHHEEHDDYLDWVGGSFDPARFDLDEANRRLGRPRPLTRPGHLRIFLAASPPVGLEALGSPHLDMPSICGHSLGERQGV